MKYKLINKQTGEEHLCDKVTIDGFDYYINNDVITEGWEGFVKVNNQIFKHFFKTNSWCFGARKVTATNNPNIDIPKVVDEVKMLAHSYFAEERYKWEQEHPDALKSPPSLVERYNEIVTPLYKAGYNKSQETHPFSDDDMIDFLEWVIFNYPNQWKSVRTLNTKGFYSTKELLQIWEEQRTKIVYYE